MNEPLTQALADLDWCCQPPHTIDQVLGIYAEELSRNGRGDGRHMSNDEILSSIVSRWEVGGGTSGHSDPTARAALSGTPDDADETLGSIDAAIGLLCDTVNELTHRTITGHARTVRIRNMTTEIHRLDLAADDRLELLIRTDLAGTAAWLRTKCEGIWLASKGETLQPAVQKPIDECRICGTWRKDTIALAAGRCAECSSFFGNHGCERTEGIVKRAEYGKGPTPAQMIEARAKKPNHKRKASA